MSGAPYELSELIRLHLVSQQWSAVPCADADHSGLACGRPYSCAPSPPDPGISGDGWIGWSWKQPGPCYYLIPPDVHCTETNGQLIVDAQAPQMAAVNANKGTVDWQFVAWSLIIYKQDATTQPVTWKVIHQTPFYWSKPTDLFDVPLSAVTPNNWRLFSAEKDGAPAFSTHAGTFRLPSLGTYTFNFSYQWYGAPSAGERLEAIATSKLSRVRLRLSPERAVRRERRSRLSEPHEPGVGSRCVHVLAVTPAATSLVRR